MGTGAQRALAYEANTAPLTAEVVVFFSLCAFFGNLGFGICGFGSGMDMAIIFLFIYTLAEGRGHLPGYDYKYAIFLQCLGLVSAVPVVMAFSKIKKHANKGLLKFAIPATIVGSPLGAFVNNRIPPPLLPLIIGIQMLVISLRDVMPKLLAKDKEDTISAPSKRDVWKDLYDIEDEVENIAGDKEDEESPAQNEEETADAPAVTGKTIGFTIFLSFLSSYLSGMVGCRGAPLVVLILRTTGLLPTESIRATGSVALGVNAFARFIFYLAYRIPGADVGYFVGEHLILYICVVIFSIIGALAGEFLARRVNREAFKTIVAAYFILTAVMNIYEAAIMFQSNGV